MYKIKSSNWSKTNKILKKATFICELYNVYCKSTALINSTVNGLKSNKYHFTLSKRAKFTFDLKNKKNAFFRNGQIAFA